MDNFSFTPTDGYEDVGSYPNPSSGTQTRTQLMSIPKQIRDWLNNTLIPKVNEISDAFKFDPAPTAQSTKLLTSGTIKTALDAKQNATPVDDTPTAASTNLVTSGGVYAAIHGDLTLTGLSLVVNGVTYTISVQNGTVTATPVS